MIYLASPLLHDNRATMLARAKQTITIVAKLRIENINVFSPIAHSWPMCEAEPELMEQKYYDAWLDLAAEILPICTQVWVLMLNGWEKSIGIKAEIKIAKENKIPVRYLDLSGNLSTKPKE